MKKKQLERWLKGNGWWLLRQGGGHECWTNGEYKVWLPRHREVDEMTVRDIMKRAESFSVDK